MLPLGSFLGIVIFLSSCAQRATLTGGDKDVFAPEIVGEIPNNESLNFNSKEIVVEFDEFIRLNNLQNQLIVSPLMEEKPEVLIKGKKLVIKLPDQLSLNTTYSLNFGDAIIDITESNPYPNYKYVFSTGNFIDSLSYSGKVVLAENMTAQEGVFVMLYKQIEDSIPLKGLPNYLAKTDKEGVFKITNIAHGMYKVFVLNDINGNYLYDLPNEQIAFLNQPIRLDSNSTDATMFLFTKESDVQYVKKIENKIFGKVVVEMAIPAQKIDLFDAAENPIVFINKEVTKNGLLHSFWLPEVLEKKQTFIVKQNNKTLDTTTVEMITKNEIKDTLLLLSSNILSIFDLNQPIKLKASQPISIVQKEKIYLFENDVLVPFNLRADTISVLNYLIIYPFKENTKYKLLVEPAAITSVYDLKNDSLISSFATKKEENYGTLKLFISPSFKENYIVQLLHKNEVVQEFYEKETKNLTIPFLLPGEYQIKLIVDSNNNKKWDTGDYTNLLQPERVIFYEDKVIIRENWDNEIKWSILTNN